MRVLGGRNSVSFVPRKRDKKNVRSFPHPSVHVVRYGPNHTNNYVHLYLCVYIHIYIPIEGGHVFAYISIGPKIDPHPFFPNVTKNIIYYRLYFISYDHYGRTLLRILITTHRHSYVSLGTCYN